MRRQTADCKADGLAAAPGDRETILDRTGDRTRKIGPRPRGERDRRRRAGEDAERDHAFLRLFDVPRRPWIAGRDPRRRLESALERRPGL